MKTQLELGATLDTLTREELSQELNTVAQTYFQQFGRGIKYLRFGPVAVKISGNAFSLDGTSTSGLSPREGFSWSILRVTVSGLATGATPDLANLYRNQPGGIPVYQFTGNNFVGLFSKFQLVLLPGETLSLANSGSIAATGSVTISGDVLEVAAEEMSKIV